MRHEMGFVEIWHDCCWWCICGDCVYIAKKTQTLNAIDPSIYDVDSKSVLMWSSSQLLLTKISEQWYSTIMHCKSYASWWSLFDWSHRSGTHSFRHYCDVIRSTMASQITSLTIVYSTVYSGTDQRKHQSSVLLAFVRGIHQWPVNSPHKGPVTPKTFPFDDVIMTKIISPTLTIRLFRHIFSSTEW